MPFAAKRPCCTFGCGNLVTRGYCEACQAKGKGQDTRPSAAARLYGHAWRVASKAYLRKHPLCVGYPRKDNVHELVIAPATCVDHIIPHRGNVELFWKRDNWQGLCDTCHSRKTVEEDGGFGRASTPGRG